MLILPTGETGEIVANLTGYTVKVPIKFKLSYGEGRTLARASVGASSFEAKSKGSGDVDISIQVLRDKLSFEGCTNGKDWTTINDRPVVLHRKEAEGVNNIRLLFDIQEVELASLRRRTASIPIRLELKDCGIIKLCILVKFYNSGDKFTVESIKRLERPKWPAINLALLFFSSAVTVWVARALEGLYPDLLIDALTWTPVVVCSFFGFSGLSSWREHFGDSDSILSLFNFPELRMRYGTFKILSRAQVAATTILLTLIVLLGGYYFSRYILINNDYSTNLAIINNKTHILFNEKKVITRDHSQYSLKCVQPDFTVSENAPSLGTIKLPKSCSLLLRGSVKCAEVNPHSEHIQIIPITISGYRDGQQEASQQIRGDELNSFSLDERFTSLSPKVELATLEDRIRNILCGLNSSIDTGTESVVIEHDIAGPQIDSYELKLISYSRLNDIEFADRINNLLEETYDFESFFSDPQPLIRRASQLSECHFPLADGTVSPSAYGEYIMSEVSNLYDKNISVRRSAVYIQVATNLFKEKGEIPDADDFVSLTNQFLETLIAGAESKIYDTTDARAVLRTVASLKLFNNSVIKSSEASNLIKNSLRTLLVQLSEADCSENLRWFQQYIDKSNEMSGEVSNSYMNSCSSQLSEIAKVNHLDRRS